MTNVHDARVEAAAAALYCMVRGVEVRDFEWPEWVDADKYRAEARAALAAADAAVTVAAVDVEGLAAELFELSHYRASYSDDTRGAEEARQDAAMLAKQYMSPALAVSEADIERAIMGRTAPAGAKAVMALLKGGA